MLPDIQLYLSDSVLLHFQLPQHELLPDTQTPLSSHWASLWRCDLIASTEDGHEHLLLFTNAVTHFSLISLDRNHNFQTLLATFHQHFILALCEHGHPFPSNESPEIEIQLLTGNTPQLERIMDDKISLAIDHLYANDVNLDLTEHSLNKQTSLTHPRHTSPPTKATAQILPFTQISAKG